MKFIVTVIFLFVVITNLSAQAKLVVINPGEEILNKTSRDMYAYNQFVKGTSYKKGKKRSEHQMNYNIRLDQMHYIDSRGDTLTLDSFSLDFLVLEKDTFYHDAFYYRVLKEYDKIKLISRDIFAPVEMHKPRTDSLNRTYFVLMTGSYRANFTLKDTFRFARVKRFYMVDLKNKVQTLRRENLIEIYPHKKKELSNYLSRYTVHLDNLKEIEKMLELLTTKQYN